MKVRIIILIVFLPALAAAGPSRNAPYPWDYWADLELYRQVDADIWSGSLNLAAGTDFHKLLVRVEPDLYVGQLVSMQTDLF